MKKMKMYCFPYAGGVKSAFFDWGSAFSDICEIIPLEYKGHGERFTEDYYANLDEAALDMYNQIIEDKPIDYILYGHSFGSMVALLTAELLEKNYDSMPRALIVGGMRPAHLKHRDKQLHHLSKDEFIKYIFELGQTDEEIMNEPELVDIIYDIMYNDVMIEEKYIYNIKKHDNINIPMIVMTGCEDDEAPVSDMKEWNKYTNSRFYIKEFKSDHFFPFNCNDFNPYFHKLLKKVSLNMI